MNTRETARKLAENSIVLLKNEESLLPFAGRRKIAFFGRAQTDLIISGSGSGAAQGEKKSDLLEECRSRSLFPAAALEAFYREQAATAAKARENGMDFSKLKEMVNSGLMYEIFGKYSPPAEEFPVPDELVKDSAKETDAAVLVIGRQSGGEECDRHLQGDYYLTDSENRLLEQVCGAFAKVAVILNTNGLIDLSWLEEHLSVKSVLFIGLPGEEGAAALANILCGRVNPSGKLAVTVAKQYEDYPAAKNFSWDKDHPDAILTYADYGLSAEENGSIGFEKSPVTVYQEDIYLGYRYFDSFRKQPLFPFGFGLSYTGFSLSGAAVKKGKSGVTVSVSVKNTGDRPGKQAVQLYISAVGTKSPHAYQELRGFAKTKELRPGESELVSMELPWEELACYVEKTAAYVIERGEYLLRLGDSSANTTVVGKIAVKEDILVRQYQNRLGLKDCNRGKINFLTGETASSAVPDTVETWTLSPADFAPASREFADGINPALKDFSTEQLAALCVGYGPGTPFAAFGDPDAPCTIFDRDGAPVTANDHPAGFNGYVSPAIQSKGISSVFYKDGPAGPGKLAWPTEMLTACCFDRALLTEFGDAVGQECEELQVDIWLAPALNLHRHPLGGRNFEYYSEDPYLAGACACAAARGVQENHPVLVCAKHFAVNEQETYRRGSSKKNYDAADSILTERAARELYLKPFEALIRSGLLHSVMTSFNKINGTFAGGNRDLCTHILREEWGFDGAVVTDWGDMDVVVDGADAVAAGNDVVMPGGPPVIAQILKGCEEGRVTREQLELAVSHHLNVLKKLGR